MSRIYMGKKKDASENNREEQKSLLSISPNRTYEQ
jgi:hypothetical protein